MTYGPLISGFLFECSKDIRLLNGPKLNLILSKTILKLNLFLLKRSSTTIQKPSTVKIILQITLLSKTIMSRLVSNFFIDIPNEFSGRKLWNSPKHIATVVDKCLVLENVEFLMLNVRTLIRDESVEILKTIFDLLRYSHLP